jgi:hypothetical protein
VFTVQLVGLFTGALTWRRLIVLLTGLPTTSRLARAMDPRNAWRVGDYLIAQAADSATLVADELAAFRWQWTTANTRKGLKKPKQPQPYPRLPRPGQKAEQAAAHAPKRARLTPGQAARALAARGGAR